jgi:hypothetical protein
MFGDPLNMAQCHGLVRALSRCRLPFQCAHGRPTLFPLADLALVDSGGGRGTSGLPRPNLRRVREFLRPSETGTPSAVQTLTRL